jgi:hypothetical protein
MAKMLKKIEGKKSKIVKMDFIYSLMENSKGFVISKQKQKQITNEQNNPKK